MDAKHSALKSLAPPRQQNLQTALARAVEALREQPQQQMEWLGAKHLAPGVWQLAVLGDSLSVNIASGVVRSGAGGEASLSWRILVLHYLGVHARPPGCPPEISFADIPDARTYAPVYQGRVIGRLCATAGRDLAHLRAGALGVHAEPVAGGDAAFDLAAFPRITMRLIWHAADAEFPPSATLLMPRNIESFFCIEDMVVLSEGIVSRLCGRPF